jgi:hypothetical protein
VFIDEIVEGHIAGQTAGTDDLQPVAIHAYLDSPAADAVIAVGYGVDQRLAHGKARVLQQLLPFQSTDRRPNAHLVEHDGPGSLDDTGDRAGEFVAAAVADTAVIAARLGAGKFDEHDAALGQESLRFAAKQQ